MDRPTDKFESAPGIWLKRVGDFKTPSFIKRYDGNPVLTASKMPYPSSLVFNSSVTEFRGKYLMLFRNEYYPVEGVAKNMVANLGIAESDDGINWDVWPDFIQFENDQWNNVYVYDPRVLKVENAYYVTLCVGSKHGPRGLTVRTEDFKTFHDVDLAPPCSRNLTLFPEKIGDYYYRLERPFWQAVDSHNNNNNQWISSPYSVFIARSPDMLHWGDYKPLLDTDMFEYANIKIGPGGAPVKTDRGWLLLTHGVDYDPSRGKNGWQDSWRNRYHGGVALLDLEDPIKVIAYSTKPFLTSEAPYERNGWRNDVIFPMSGMQMDNGEFYIYYGAADMHTCLATCKLDDLLDFCFG